MSDPDKPHPVDDLYVRAEAVLDDEAARAARRARVLAVVTEAAAVARPTRRSWRLDPRWGAAAVVVLGVVVASTLPKPIVSTSRPASSPPPAASVAPTASAAPPPALPAPSVSEVRKRETPVVAAPPPLSRAEPPPPPPLPLPPVIAPAPQPAGGDVAASLADEASAKAAAPNAQGRIERPAARAAVKTPDSVGARLRAAAATGRTAEIEALLGEGVPIDAADAQGDTALVVSVRAGRLATVALLRRHGADPDRTNKAGESATSIAAAKGDARLVQALRAPD